MRLRKDTAANVICCSIWEGLYLPKIWASVSIVKVSMVASPSSVDKEIADAGMSGRPHVVILGAGASLAAFPNGDRNGRRLPLMNNLVDVLDLESLLASRTINYDATDFEAIYADLCESPDSSALQQSIEQRVYEYFRALEIPDEPTLYDHLVLSLRGKDLIASFNWDPLLFQACARNYLKMELPKISFLHGNVTIGYCKKDKKAGSVPGTCKKCHKPFKRTPLLYPIKKKDYGNDPFIAATWRDLRRWLKGAFMVTIFGYSGPASDVEALKIMKQAWGKANTRELEQIEIIDIKEEDELRLTWSDFIHTHHYQTCTDFYDSWIARHPRRTCEAMWNQNMEIEFLDDNKIPVGLSSEELWNWFEPLGKAELENHRIDQLSGKITLQSRRTSAKSDTNNANTDMKKLPHLVIAADWGSKKKKRSMVQAELGEDHCYHVLCPKPVGEIKTFIDRIQERLPEGRTALMGFDFPIGLPREYAEKAGLKSWREALRDFGGEGWENFYEVSDNPSPRQPFYPKTLKGSSRTVLAESLGFNNLDELLRVCERKTSTRPKAECLFFTLGPKQVGRGAMEGWKNVFAPLIEKESVKFWPFDGSLDELLNKPGIVIAEIYPREAYSHLGINIGPGTGLAKTRREDRKKVRDRFFDAADGQHIALSKEARSCIRSGFDSDDDFDAMVGLLSMLKIVTGEIEDGLPNDDPLVRTIEGWILGQRPQGTSARHLDR